ncbi:zinc ribbon domain-containing protein [Bdellovibrionota bacterium]
MFCPVCHSEYRPGFSFCPHCEVDLVEQLEKKEDPTVPEGFPEHVVGADLSKELHPDEVEKHCPACSEEAQEGETVCSNCGLTLLFDHEEFKEEKGKEKSKIDEWETKEKRRGLLLLPVAGGIILLIASRGAGSPLLLILGGLLVAIPLFKLLRDR